MRVKEFVSLVGKMCREAFLNSDTPLVVAAVDYLQPVFREACRLDQLVPEAVTGSPDELSVQEMYSQALKLVDAWRERRVVDFEGTYENRLAHGRASHRLEMIVPAAEEGRIEDLVIGSELRVWGQRKSADSGNGVTVHVERLPGDVDLLELVVRETLLHGGRLHAVEPGRMIEGAPAAAILRW
jgi:hypothetical protein